MSRLRCRPRRRRLTLAVLGAIVALVVIGPLLAPHPEDVVVSAPYAAAGDGGSLGTDVLGRDVLSRVLRGGGELLLTAALAAIGGTVLGAVAGLIAAVRRRWLGLLLERVTEIVLVVPSVLILVGTAISDPSPLVVPAVLALLATPCVARVVVAAAAAEPVIRAGYVEHALASGESTWWIITRDVAPNMRATLLTLLGLRFVEAVYLVSAAAFLQVGPQPPEANWALMVRENAQGVLLNPWATAAPSLAIATIAVAVTYDCDRHRLREPPL